MTKTTAMAVKAMAPEVDPRVRMKEVRADIKMFVEGENPWGINHVGEMYDNQEDMSRAMIALHDMLDARAQKHNKASNHVAELLQDLDEVAQANFNLQTHLAQHQTTIAFLDTHGKQEYDRANEAEKLNQKLKEDLMIQAKKLEAALLTIHTVMEG